MKSITRLTTDIPSIGLGDVIEIIHKPNGKITDKCMYYLKDVSAWEERKTIAKTEFKLVVPPYGVKPKIKLKDDERFIVKVGKAFSYYIIRIRESYERPNNIESVYINKVIS